MSGYLVVKATDTRPARWRATEDVLNDVGKLVETPIDLTGATVVVNVRIRKPVGAKIPLAGTPLTPYTEGLFAHPYDTLAPGEYDLQAVVTKDGQTMTVPTAGYATLIVEQNM